VSGRIVSVTIDELALEGFTAPDRQRIAAATTSELQRLLTERPAWSGAPAESVVHSLAAPPGATPEAIGAQVARAVHSELTP
jgi:hypothetical protein